MALTKTGSLQICKNAICKDKNGYPRDKIEGFVKLQTCVMVIKTSSARKER